MKVNVLGTEYEIVQANEQDYPYLEQADGFCDTSIKKIVVRDCKDKENDPSSLGDLEYYEKKSYKARTYTRFFIRKRIVCKFRLGGK